MMIGSLLELGGPKAVTEPLAQFPPGQRRELVRTVLAARCCPGYLRDLMDADAAAETNAEVIARIAREREPVDLTMDDILAARDEGRR